MAHDVFISHSSRDKAVADALCSHLENRGIRCWIAPRDISPGADWGESILRAMAGSQIMVLLLSQNANTSPQIKREVERAVNRGVVIVPVRIEDVLPASSLEYFLSTAHWLDAFPPPTDQYFGRLGSTVEQILANRSGWQRSPASMRPQPSSTGAVQRPGKVPPWWQAHQLKLIILVCLVVTMAGLGAGLLVAHFLQGPKMAKNESLSTPENDSKVLGIWRQIQDPNPGGSPRKMRGTSYNGVILAALTSATSRIELQLFDAGKCRLKSEAEDTGQFKVTSSAQSKTALVESGVITFISNRGFSSVDVKYMILPPPSAQLDLTGLNYKELSTWDPVQSGSKSGVLTQLWSTSVLDFTQHGSLWVEPYKAQLDLSDLHNYRINLTLNVSGKYEFKNGHFRFFENGLITQVGYWEGTYALPDPSTLQLNDSDGVTRWTRVTE